MCCGVLFQLAQCHSILYYRKNIKSFNWNKPFENELMHLPDDHDVTPADFFVGTQIPRCKINDIHVWKFIVYVSDPTSHQGKKLPCWEPRARQGIFFGFSAHHSSDVSLVLDISTGHIYPQYHVVFDNSFSTVNSHAKEEDPPSFWNEIVSSQ